MKKITGALLACSTLLTACGGDSSSSSGGTSDTCTQLNSDQFNCSEMIGALADVQSDAVSEFSTSLSTLKQDTDSYCSNIGTEQEATARATARDSWVAAMLDWQTLEVMQFGPVADARNDFYSWPLSVNKTCNMDGVIASGNTDSATPQVLGLPAVEYVLYQDGPLNSCTSQPAAAADAAERCEFAQAAIRKMTTALETLESDLEDYAPATDPGGQATAQEIFDAVFYVYNETKGEKLQKTLLPQTANDSFKPENLEIPFADINVEAIAANLKSTQSLMQAADRGFASYLEAAGEQDLASDMLSALATAISAAEGFETSFRDILTTAEADSNDDDVSQCINATADTTGSDVAELCALDSKIKAFTDDLKGQMALNLGLSVPQDAESDGD